MNRRWKTIQRTTVIVQKSTPICAKSIKRITRQERWKARHMRVYSTRMTMTQAKQFDEACEAAAEKPYRLLRRLALEWADKQRVSGWL